MLWLGRRAGGQALLAAWPAAVQGHARSDERAQARPVPRAAPLAALVAPSWVSEVTQHAAGVRPILYSRPGVRRPAHARPRCRVSRFCICPGSGIARPGLVEGCQAPHAVTLLQFTPPISLLLLYLLAANWGPLFRGRWRKSSSSCSHACLGAWAQAPPYM